MIIRTRVRESNQGGGIQPGGGNPTWVESKFSDYFNCCLSISASNCIFFVSASIPSEAPNSSLRFFELGIRLCRLNDHLLHIGPLQSSTSFGGFRRANLARHENAAVIPPRKQNDGLVCAGGQIRLRIDHLVVLKVSVRVSGGLWQQQEQDLWNRGSSF